MILNDVPLGQWFAPSKYVSAYENPGAGNTSPDRR